MIPVELVDAVLSEGFGEDVAPDEREFWHATHQENYAGDAGRQRLRLATINLSDRDGLHHRLDGVRCPVLWLHGTADPVYSVANAEEEIRLFVNSADAERLLQVHNHLLTDLSTPPVLRELAQQAAMSETKLKQLFKQTFGSSVYTYFQQARMKEAAFLLKQGQHSVAEVGYELGFSNLSHFSRLFEKHYGLHPKRYSQS